ncbi:tetratricopeptide repeat protein [Pantoea sp. Nvir]|uniref:YfgM family protein n=1 Tax=Pantoea sp. Nvir TaxID=2576760 RepID=UPI001356B9BF|nr:tetratricopeptide repeat protein [Pantoea sp. Nvir]MXP66555.1 tetratricopeptide repeat protein [Pantoea sp. Nvir]CAJ0992224.1 hypothetical protein NVIRPANT_00576 [Pantoea sp. Nvir]
MYKVHYFFTNNSKILAVSVIIGIATAFGSCHYWHSHKEGLLKIVSSQYQKLTADMKANPLTTLNAAVKFASENSNTYGMLAALEAAKQYVEANQLEKATSLLGNSLKNTTDPNLQAIISVRLARIQQQQKQSDTVLRTLDTIKGDGWEAIVEDIRGEALLSKGDTQGARDAWSKGIKSDDYPMLRRTMQMKINNLR